VKGSFPHAAEAEQAMTWSLALERFLLDIITENDYMHIIYMINVDKTWHTRTVCLGHAGRSQAEPFLQHFA
jgi:hypothetical protein